MPNEEGCWKGKEQYKRKEKENVNCIERKKYGKTATYNSSLQHFWHQGLVCWKTIFLRMGGMVSVSCTHPLLSSSCAAQYRSMAWGLGTVTYNIALKGERLNNFQSFYQLLYLGIDWSLLLWSTLICYNLHLCNILILCITVRSRISTKHPIVISSQWSRL